MTIPHHWACHCLRCKPGIEALPPRQGAVLKWIINDSLIIDARDYYEAREFGFKLIGTGEYPRTVVLCPTKPCPLPVMPAGKTTG